MSAENSALHQINNVNYAALIKNFKKIMLPNFWQALQTHVKKRLIVQYRVFQFITPVFTQSLKLALRGDIMSVLLIIKWALFANFLYKTHS